MKYCFTTVVSDNFVYGFIVMITTFLEKNPWLDCPFYVFYNDEECPLSAENRKEMRKYYKNIRFYHVDLKKFEKILYTRDNIIKTPDRLASAFFILESFTFSSYDRVICIDSDMIILDNLAELLEIECDLAVTRAYDHENNLPLPFFNSGLVIIGKKHLHKNVFKDMSDSLRKFDFNTGYGKADQAILNLYFRDKKLVYLEPSFNVTKRFYPDNLVKTNDLTKGKNFIYNRLVRDGVLIMHYVNEKPWNTKHKEREIKYRFVEELWHDAFKKHARTSTKLRYIDFLRQQSNNVILEMYNNKLKAG